MEKTINSVEEFVKVLKDAKCKGAFVSMECETKITLRKFPTDGSAKVHIEDGFEPTSHFVVSYHFGASYENAMTKILGVPYDASDDNREHIVSNLLMRYKSTGNVCAIYMPTSRKDLGVFLNGTELTQAQKDYMKKYLPKPSGNAYVEYRTIGIANIRAITMSGIRYIINLAPIKKVA